MKRSSLVFSLVREQSIFMTVVISVLTFLSVLTFGIALSVGTGVIRWNNQWDKYATVQVMKKDNTKSVQKIFTDNANKIESLSEITESEMKNMIKPWISSGAKLKNYLPQMFEVKFKTAQDLKDVSEKISTYAKFLPHTSALKSSINTGWKIVGITLCVLIIMLVSIALCISYISRNIAMLHKHELEILNQVGATDSFIARQMQIIVGKICFVACSIGFIVAVPLICVFLGIAHSARIGMLATLTLTGNNWLALIILPIVIMIFSIYITKKTTLKILAKH